jgi:hypothetical protein
MKQSQTQLRKDIQDSIDRVFGMVFQGVATDPRHWLGYARSLKLAASILQPHFDNEPASQKGQRTKAGEPRISPIYFLLVGFAIENYAKAISVIRDPDVVSKGKLVRLKSHSLLGLLSGIGFRLSPEEDELVERLEEFVLWAGRYPIPTKVQTIAPRRRRHPQLGDWLIYSVKGDSILCVSIMDRLEETTLAEMKSSRSGG